MRDLEFILRFFALNTPEILNARKGNISLKKNLNEFMGAKENNTPEKIQLLEKEFNDIKSTNRLLIITKKRELLDSHK